MGANLYFLHFLANVCECILTICFWLSHSINRKSFRFFYRKFNHFNVWTHFFSSHFYFVRLKIERERIKCLNEFSFWMEWLISNRIVVTKERKSSILQQNKSNISKIWFTIRHSKTYKSFISIVICDESMSSAFFINK